MWECTATLQRQEQDGYTRVCQIPTFHLNSNLLGILTAEGAEHIAKKILNPFNDPKITVNVWAFKSL